MADSPITFVARGMLSNIMPRENRKRIGRISFISLKLPEYCVSLDSPIPEFRAIEAANLMTSAM